MTLCVNFRAPAYVTIQLMHIQGDLSVKPTLRIMNRNKKDKTIGITRGSQVVYVQPSATQDIEDGDIVSLVSGITLM